MNKLKFEKTLFLFFFKKEFTIIYSLFKNRYGYELNRKTWPKILPKKIESVIHSLVYYKWYENIKNIDLIGMATDVLTRLSQTQFLLKRGNKNETGE
ncbi:hypothetical protein [Spiroplasma melliferum]|uniref:Uncharacterized protein n=2 Tax=Spiroplasma melliferum TaxID=2134 RepID=A0AAI9X1H8_SPIME|nr:hypothetical protein [Spiroplasma melliferum]KAI93113.1 hypothetical protein SPM_000735 [Spiroplasma melliferum KC3]QCO24223.1 hypothetical protein SRED_002711 [Spiroplasma melliferum]